MRQFPICQSSQTSLPVPPDLREVLTAFEAGRPMVDVRVATWDSFGRESSALRQQVFVTEQKILADLERDAADALCLHAVAYNRLGVPLATDRLQDHVPGVAKIGRMAVQAPMRGSGLGRAELDAHIQAARAR